MAFQAGAIVSKLTLDRSKFSASIKAVKKQSKNLGSWVKKNSGQFKAMGLAATAAGVAVLLVFKKMVKVYVETGDMIHKMAIRTGFAAETLSELAYAANISGADISMLAKGVKNMAKVLTYASDGLETYAREFERINLDYRDLLKLSPEEQFFKIAEAIAEVEVHFTKSAAAQVIFGRAGFQLLPLFEEGAEGIKKLRKEAHVMGEIFDTEAAAGAAALMDAQTGLKASTRGLSIAILTDLIPVLTGVTKRFTDWFIESRKGAKSWTEAILGVFKLIAKGLETLVIAWGGLKIAVFAVSAAIVDKLVKIAKGIQLIAKAAPALTFGFKLIKAENFDQFIKDLTAVSEGYREEVDKGATAITNTIDKFEAFVAMLNKVGTGTKETKKETKSFWETLLEGVPSSNRVGEAFKLLAIESAGTMEIIEKTWQDTMREILAGATSVVGGLNSVFSQLHANEATRIDDEEKKKTDAIESWYEQNRARIESTITDEIEKVAALEALDEEKARAENTLQVKMDKERRKLERKRAKAQKATALISAGINVAEAITKALTAGPLIGQIFAGIVAALGAVQMAAIAAAPLPALARGGRIGAAGIVGEEGPELFFPRTPGTIVPLRSEATPLGSQPSISIRIMGSLISTTGVARADLERAGKTLFDIVEMQARRRGYTLNGA